MASATTNADGVTVFLKSDRFPGGRIQLDRTQFEVINDGSLVNILDPSILPAEGESLEIYFIVE